tara:strand:- start:2783 stop:3274 length:492 start_codon:yes stop_codon:yes gene_type:complete
MDILTPRGQESRKWEDRAVKIWSSHYPDIIYASTDKDTPCVVDAVLVKNGKILGVVEQKSRPGMTVLDFNVTYEKRWLVTQKKLDDASEIAQALQTKLVGFLYFPEADVLLVKTLMAPGKGWVTDIRTEHTRTQATINGGSAVRLNAYIDMTDALVLYGDFNG